MAWQDDELKKWQQDAKNTASAEERKRIQRQQIKEYWDKLLEANNRLDSRIKLVVCSENTIIQKGIIRQNDADYLNYSAYEAKIMADGFVIYFDCDAGRFIGEHLMLHKHDNTVYDIDESSIDILLRNLCTGRRIYEGLKPHSLKDRLCFVATVAYGSAYAREVLFLRKWRDEVLLKYRLGTSFVRFYYLFSPSLSNYLSTRHTLKAIMKHICLNPLIFCLEHIFKKEISHYTEEHRT